MRIDRPTCREQKNDPRFYKYKAVTDRLLLEIGTIYEDVCKTQGYALPANVSDYPPDKEIRRPHNFDAYRYSQFKVRDSLKRNLCPYDLRGIRNSGVVSPYADAEQPHQTSSC